MAVVGRVSALALVEGAETTAVDGVAKGDIDRKRDTGESCDSSLPRHRTYGVHIRRFNGFGTVWLAGAPKHGALSWTISSRADCGGQSSSLATVPRGLDKAIASVWDGGAGPALTVHKHRNLSAHAPECLHDEITADYNDMIYATMPEEIETRRKAFIHKWG